MNSVSFSSATVVYLKVTATVKQFGKNSVNFVSSIPGRLYSACIWTGKELSNLGASALDAALHPIETAGRVQEVATNFFTTLQKDSCDIFFYGRFALENGCSIEDYKAAQKVSAFVKENTSTPLSALMLAKYLDYCRVEKPSSEEPRTEGFKYGEKMIPVLVDVNPMGDDLSDSKNMQVSARVGKSAETSLATMWGDLKLTNKSEIAFHLHEVIEGRLFEGKSLKRVTATSRHKISIVKEPILWGLFSRFALKDEVLQEPTLREYIPGEFLADPRSPARRSPSSPERKR